MNGHELAVAVLVGYFIGALTEAFRKPSAEVHRPHRPRCFKVGPSFRLILRHPSGLRPEVAAAMASHLQRALTDGNAPIILRDGVTFDVIDVEEPGK